MRILGIDPGSGATGYGIIDTDGTTHRVVVFGAITTQARRPFHERLHKIHRDLIEVLSREKADIMAIEDIFHAVNVQSALRLGHARGVALLVAAQLGMDVFAYSPLEIKSAVVGYGRAEKGQIQSMVRILLGLAELPSPDHAADALAVAICHAHRMKVASVQNPPRADARG